MIAVHLSGGLGNQMFQYAFGRHLSEKFHTELLLDVRSFDQKPGHNFDSDGVAVRSYELGCFDFQPTFADAHLNKFFFPSKHFLSRASNKIERLLGKKKLLYERKYGFDAHALEEVGRNTYLHGYWQSHKYFESSIESIRRDFTFLMPHGRSIELESEINQTNSVAIHIRRGDYVSSAAVNSVHGVIPIAYYQRAIELMSIKQENISWFVFSDDIEWCKKAFSFLKNSTFVSDQLRTPSYYEMYLISLCKNHIIANSSFSWWGAWLSSSPTKVVIAPLQWFSDPLLNKNSKDISPAAWIRL